MSSSNFLNTLEAWWPVLIAVVMMIIVLAKMHSTVEVLSEKVKVLFEIINKYRP
jgi:hypothetical protein